MSNLFNSENWFWQGFGRIADYFILSILWMLTSLPVLTAGTACIAFYDTAAHCFRYGERDMVGRFFRTFRKELLRGVSLTVFWGILILALNMSYQIISQNAQAGDIWSMVSAVYFFTLFIPLGCICWTIALESRFVYSFGHLLKNALLFTFAHLPQTLAVAALFVVTWNICLNFPFFVMVLPGVMGHLQVLFIEKVLGKYMPEEEAVSIETTVS